MHSLMSSGKKITMDSLADFDFDSCLLSESIILISLLIRPDFPVDSVQEQLQQLVEQAQAVIDTTQSQEQQLEQLIALFYHEWGFGSVSGVYQLSDSLWLDRVLVTRQGMPASLGIIFLHVAYHLGLPLQPVIFPTQMILRVDWLDEELWLLNPLNGETLSEHILTGWMKGNLGITAEVSEDDLESAENREVIKRLLNTLKAALMEENKLALALQACQALLIFSPNDPYETRDRGLIYLYLGCIHVALVDLRYFVEQCPKDPVTHIVKAQIQSIESQEVVLH